MKRSMETIRKLLIHIENKEGCEVIDWELIKIHGREPGEIIYNLNSMCQAGYLECEPKALDDKDGPAYKILNLTWEGHEFLEGIRNEDNWKQINEYAKERGFALSAATIKKIVNFLIDVNMD